MADARVLLAVRPGLALACGAAAGVLGGLIGLGGAEFSLPLLTGLLARLGVSALTRLIATLLVDRA